MVVWGHAAAAFLWEAWIPTSPCVGKRRTEGITPAVAIRAN
jgi:hypothetical protein